MTEEVRQTILAALPGVEAAQLTVSEDGSRVKVGLREEQLAAVFRENGRYIRGGRKRGQTLHFALEGLRRAE